MKRKAKNIIVGIGLFLLTSPVFATNLLDVYQQALTNDPTFKIARSDWLIVKENIAISRSGLLPQFDINGDLGRSINKRSILELSSGKYMSTMGDYSLTLNQPLFNYQAWASIKTAKASEKSAAASYSYAAQDIIYRTASAYLDVLRAQAVLRTTKAEKKAIREQLENIKHRFKVGMATIADLRQTETSYALVVSQEIHDKNDLSIQKEKLHEITNQYYSSFATLNDKKLHVVSPQPENPMKWVDVARRQNYQLLASRYNMASAEENIRTQSSARYPTASLQGSYGYDYESNYLARNESNTDQVALANVNVNFPVIQGGRVTAQTRQAQYQYERSVEELEKVDRSVASITHQTYLNVIASIEQITANKTATRAARTSLKATEASYRVGSSTMVDVLQQLTDMYSAERDYTISQYEYLIQTLSLKLESGTLSVDDIAKINSWLR